MTRMNKPSDDFGGSADFFNEQASEMFEEVYRPRPRRINVDVVFVLDLTSSMEKYAQRIRQQGVAFVDRIFEAFRRKIEKYESFVLGRKRARIVGFRDYGSSRNEAIAQTRFFDLENEEDREKLDRVLTKLPCAGGRSGKKNALEALHHAVNSRWDRDESCGHRHFIIVLTDSPARPLKDARSVANPYYPKDPNMPGTLDELCEKYCDIHNGQSQRLLLCAPMKEYPWGMLSTWSYASLWGLDWIWDEDGFTDRFEDQLGCYLMLD